MFDPQKTHIFLFFVPLKFQEMLFHRFFAKAGRRHFSSTLTQATLLVCRAPLELRPLSEYEREYEAYQQALQYEFSSGPIVKNEPKDTNTAASSSDAIKENPLSTKDSRRLPDRWLYLTLQSDLDQQWTFPFSKIEDQKVSMSEVLNELVRRLLGSNSDYHLTSLYPLAHHYEAYEDRTAPPLGCNVISRLF